MKRTMLAALLAASFGGPAAANEASATITASELREHVGYLASDELAGRDTGSEGERAAGEYLARHLERYGLEPLGEDGGFFQPFDVAGDMKLEQATMRIEHAEFYRDFAARKDFVPFSFSGSGRVEVPLVFAGYGITDPQRNYDDYEGLDVAGKAVLILRHEPREDPRAFTPHAHFTTKAQNARKHGAVAMLVVTDPVHHPGDDDLMPFGRGDDLGLIAVQVRQSAVQGLFRLAGRDLAATQRKIDEGLRPDSFELGSKVALDMKIARTTIKARNVVARLQGSDPALKDEVVVVGAHYDHVGMGGENSLDSGRGGPTIHNGADDNASGTAGMLELAQAFAQARPRRTILFVGFSGEERGLLGSEHFVKHPPVKLERIVAMVNLDMIGRLRRSSLEVGGVGTSPGFEALVKSALEAQGLRGTLDPSGYGPSDHASFYAAKVPVLFFFTGIHEDYHRPGDDADKFVADGAEKVARAAFLCTEQLANADARPAYTEVARAGRGGNRPRLGIRLDLDRGSGGVRVVEAVEGGPAAKAGIRAEDIVVKLGDAEIDNARDLMVALGKLKFDDEVKVEVLRGTERLTLEVTLTRP